MFIVKSIVSGVKYVFGNSSLFHSQVESMVKTALCRRIIITACQNVKSLSVSLLLFETTKLDKLFTIYINRLVY